jgi:hypothetical protein
MDLTQRSHAHDMFRKLVQAARRAKFVDFPSQRFLVREDGLSAAKNRKSRHYDSNAACHQTHLSQQWVFGYDQRQPPTCRRRNAR